MRTRCVDNLQTTKVQLFNLGKKSATPMRSSWLPNRACHKKRPGQANLSDLFQKGDYAVFDALFRPRRPA